MAFVIPDNMRSRKGVPAGIRRAASAFQIALDDDATVWFEPPFDPSGERPHFVVLLPDRGVAVLECLDASWGQVLGSAGPRLRLERDGQEVEVENPIARAAEMERALRERFAAEPRLKGQDVRSGHGAIFPGLERRRADALGVGEVFDLDTCLFKGDLDLAVDGEGDAALARVFARILPGGSPIPKELDAVIRGILQPDTVIGGAVAATQEQLAVFVPPDEGDIVRVMDRRQEALAKGLGDGHRVIRGVAGSGKTLVLVHRARLLSRLLPAQRLLVTCYTRSLASQLRSLLGDCPNVEVVHLDKLMAQLIRTAKGKHPGYDDPDAPARAARAALEAGHGPRYRAVLVDEAQDFSTDALQVTVGLLEEGDADLVVVADAAQNIFRRKFSWRQAGIQAQGRTRILRVNYRNTREILEFASGFLLRARSLHADEAPDPEDENAVVPPEAAARSGELPRLRVVPSVAVEVDAVIEEVRGAVQDDDAPASVAVLYSAANEGDVRRAHRVVRGLRDAGVEAFWMTDPADKEARDRLAESRAPVVVSTVHSAKGLEFATVVLCGLWQPENDEDTNRKIAYVGMTRAMERLIVVTADTHPLVADLRAALEGAAADAERGSALASATLGSEG